MYRALRQWADSRMLVTPQLIRSSAGARSVLLRPRAGAAAKRQSRQDKQRRKVEELRQRTQQASPRGEARKSGAALQWLAQQEPQRTDEEDLYSEADDCINLEVRVWYHYFACFDVLGIFDGKTRKPGLLPRIMEEFVAHRVFAYAHSIAQFQASPSSCLDPPSLQDLLDCVWEHMGDVLLAVPGPSAAYFLDSRELLDKVGMQVAVRFFEAGLRNRFNSAGRLDGTHAEVEAELHRVSRVVAHRILVEELDKFKEELRRLDSESAVSEAVSEEEPEPEPQAAASPELQRQQDAVRMRRRAERAIRAAEAQAKRAREAEAARSKAAFNVGLLQRLQQAAEYQAEVEGVKSREQAERGRRNAVRRTREAARTRNTLSAKQWRIWEEEFKQMGWGK